MIITFVFYEKSKMQQKKKTKTSKFQDDKVIGEKHIYIFRIQEQINGEH